MALFKVITEDEKGNKILYKKPEDLIRLIHYVQKKSVYFETYNLFPLDVDSIINQMLYLQSCKGGEIHTRALHFVLSFDTQGWEWEMVREKVFECIHVVYFAAEAFGLQGYQCCAGVHDLKSHKHIHFVLNPVNITTKKILHYYVYQYTAFLRELSMWLFSKFRIVLMDISYVDENGHLRFYNGSNKTSFLYENRLYSHESLR